MSLVVVTDAACTQYEVAGHPERPARISGAIRHLQRQVELEVVWELPGPVEDRQLLRAHTEGHLVRLREPRGFDPDTPWYEGIDGFARCSVGAALTALDHALDGRRALCLMRPPGHHATPDRAMGFCYLNSAAVVALEARARGCARVAVFDFDVHHGNGTEDILHGREGLLFSSVHQHPCYPGTGTEHRDNCRNFPVAPGLAAAEHRAVLLRALEEIEAFRPECVVVSAGFDAYAGDPLAQMRLQAGDFHAVGEALGALGVPVVSVLEGGYSAELPQLIHEYCVGWCGA